MTASLKCSVLVILYNVERILPILFFAYSAIDNSSKFLDNKSDLKSRIEIYSGAPVCWNFCHSLVVICFLFGWLNTGHVIAIDMEVCHR